MLDYLKSEKGALDAAVALLLVLLVGDTLDAVQSGGWVSATVTTLLVGMTAYRWWTKWRPAVGLFWGDE